MTLPAPRSTIYAELLDRARQEPFGLSIRTNNARQLQLQFAEHTRDIDGPRDIRACCTPDPEVLFLVKTSVELP
jgi:hypothetical protein